MNETAEPKIIIDEDAQRVLLLAIQVADKAVEWTYLLQAEKESGNNRATLNLLEAEATLMSLAMTYKSHLDIFHGLAEAESDDTPF